MFELRILIIETGYKDPFIIKPTEEILQYRVGEYLEEDEEGWKDVPKHTIYK